DQTDVHIRAHGLGWSHAEFGFILVCNNWFAVTELTVRRFINTHFLLLLNLGRLIQTGWSSCRARRCRTCSPVPSFRGSGHSRRPSSCAHARPLAPSERLGLGRTLDHPGSTSE